MKEEERGEGRGEKGRGEEGGEEEGGEEEEGRRKEEGEREKGVHKVNDRHITIHTYATNKKMIPQTPPTYLLDFKWL